MGLKRGMIMGAWNVCKVSVFGTLRRRLITREDSTRNSRSVKQRLHHPATSLQALAPGDWRRNGR